MEIDELPAIGQAPARGRPVVPHGSPPDDVRPGADEAGADEAGTVEPGAAEDRTRDRVCLAVLEHGPVSAGQLARTLGLTAAGVRRHLDLLLEQGMVTAREPATGGRRGRGRPAKLFVLTDSGHAAMSSGYDDLAAQALQYLSEVAGPEAVRGFARRRLHDLESRYRPVVLAAGPDPLLRAQALAGALSADGFAASTRALVAPVDAAGAGVPIGIQLCQGHCPVQHVARQFPQLCEAETDAFSRLLGVHVQRLATLAHGEHVCTTHVPAAPHRPTGGTGSVRSTERSDER